jgi:hypothetical protein
LVRDQQSPEYFGGAISMDLSFGSHRLDGSMEECLDLSNAVGDEGAQLPVVRRCHFKRRVDQKASPPRAVAHRMLNDLFDSAAAILRVA